MGNITSPSGIHDPIMQEVNRNIGLVFENRMSFGRNDMYNDALQKVRSISEQLRNSSVQLIFHNDEKFLEELEINGNVNSVDDITGLTPIMACAVLERHDLGLKCIEKGAFLNMKTKFGLSTLMIACILKDEDFVDILLKKPTKINYAEINTSTSRPETNSQVDSLSNTALKHANINDTHMGVTALFYAVLAGNADIVENLVSSGANVEVCTSDGTTALHLAAIKGSKELMQVLLTSGCNTDPNTLLGHTPLMWSVLFNNTKSAQVLIENGASVNKPDVCGNTALHMAAAAKHRESVALLLDRAADCSQLNKLGQTPLIVAALFGDEHIVDKLIKYRQDVSRALVNCSDKAGHTALFYASFQGHRHVVELLIKEQDNPHAGDHSGMTPLMAACINGHDKVVEMLLNIKPHALDHRFYSALAQVVTLRQTNIVNIMLPRKQTIKPLKEMQETLPELAKTCPLLHIAAENGDLDIIKILISAGADINSYDQFGRSALIVAAHAKHDKIVKLLLEHDADTNSCDIGGNTPLILASLVGCSRIVKMLIEKRADLTLSNFVGRSALTEAANNGFYEIVEMLCLSTTNIDVKEMNGWTPLMLAAQHDEFVNVVQFLIKRGASVESRTRHDVTAVMISAGNGCMQTTKLLVEKGANINKQDINGYTPLLYAASQGHSQTARFLITRGADVNIDDLVLKQSPLSFSILCGDVETSEMLIKAGADVNLISIDGRSCLHYAAAGGHHQLVKLLQEHGAAVDVADALKRTPLMLAAYKGDSRSVQYLIEKGANYNLCCTDGWSPLMLCSQEGHVECMQALLDTGNIKMEYKEKLGHSALSISAANNKHDAVCLLLKKHADPNTRNNSGQTPLMLSAYNGDIEVVKTLIEFEASLDLIDTDGKTALMIAAEINRCDIVKALLEARADINATTNNKMTALHVSVRNKNMEIVKLLLRNKDIVVDIADVEGNTPLMSSARTDSNSILISLLQAKADITRQNKEGKTAIDICIEKNNSDAVKYLCQKGYITEADKNKYIDLATKCKCTEILTILNQTIKDDSCQTAVHDNDSNLSAASDDDTSTLNDCGGAVAEDVDRSPGFKVECTTNIPPNKDSNGVAASASNTITVKCDPTGTVTFDKANINTLIVNVNKTDIWKPQNVAIGDHSSIRPLIKPQNKMDKNDATH